MYASDFYRPDDEFTATSTATQRRMPPSKVAIAQPEEIVALLTTEQSDQIGALADFNRELASLGVDIRRQLAYTHRNKFTVASVVVLPDEHAVMLLRRHLHVASAEVSSLQVVRNAWTLSVTVLDEIGAFSRITKSVTLAGGNIRFWHTFEAPGSSFGTLYMKAEGLIDYPADELTVFTRASLEAIYDEHNGVYDMCYDLRRGVKFD